MLSELALKMNLWSAVFGCIAVLSILVFGQACVNHSDQGTRNLAQRVNRAKNAGGFWAVVFWGFWWLMIIVVYQVFSILDWGWVLIILDLGNMAILLSAYALWRQETFVWSDPFVFYLIAGLAFLCVWDFALGVMLGYDEVGYRLFVMSPSQVIASVALVGFGAAATSIYKGRAAPLLVFTLLYAAIQMPVYFLNLVAPVIRDGPEDPDATAIMFMLAVGKLVFLITFSTLCISQTGLVGKFKTWDYIVSCLNFLFGVGILLARFGILASL